MQEDGTARQDQSSTETDSGVFPPLVGVAHVLTGPTASGKSRVSIEWAKRINGEILSLDSIAVYQAMDIGSAKPSPGDQKSVPHHLIDLVAANEEFSVACYLQAAHRAVAEIRDRGKTPIFVGGTPMFLKGILRGFDPGPPADWDFRSSVEQDLKVHGIDALYQRLRQVDPLAAHRINRNDSRRMIRALEVAMLTGRPISHQQNQFENSVAPSNANSFALYWDRAELHSRIEKRVEQMFADGLVAEVESLLQQFGSLSRTAAQAVGYREVIQHIEGELSLSQCKEQVIFHTRRLARRQETWFRSFSEIRRVEMNDERSIDDIVGELASE